MHRPNSKTLKLIVLEFIQWSAFASVVFVSAQKLAVVSQGSYTLVIVGSIGYVAGATLLIWIPIKLTFQWMKFFTFLEGKWCPSTFVYVLLSALPCSVISMVGIDRDYDVGFQSVCVELMVVMLVVVDISEKMKYYRLRSDDDNNESAIENGENNQSLQSTRNFYKVSSSASRNQHRQQRFSWTDSRPAALLDSMLNAYDIRLILGLLVKDHDILMNWNKAIYIIALFGMFPFIVTHKLPYKFGSTVLLLDVPFFFLRLSIICVFGFVTDALFLLKNLFSLLCFLYFCFVRPVLFKPKALNIIVNSVEFVTSNGNAHFVGDSSYYHQEYSNEYHNRSREDSFQDDDDPNEEEDHIHNENYYSQHDQRQTDDYNYHYQTNGVTHSMYDDKFHTQYNDATNDDTTRERFEQDQGVDYNYIGYEVETDKVVSSAEKPYMLHQNENSKSLRPAATISPTQRRKAPQPPRTKFSKPSSSGDNVQPLPVPLESSSFSFPPPPHHFFAPAEDVMVIGSDQTSTSHNKFNEDTPRLESAWMMEDGTDSFDDQL